MSRARASLYRPSKVTHTLQRWTRPHSNAAQLDNAADGATWLLTDERQLRTYSNPQHDNDHMILLEHLQQLQQYGGPDRTLLVLRKYKDTGLQASEITRIFERKHFGTSHSDAWHELYWTANGAVLSFQAGAGVYIAKQDFPGEVVEREL